MDVNINTARLQSAIASAFQETVLIMDAEFSKAITDPVWPWPYGDSPRNIVDTGRLRLSQQVPLIRDGSAIFEWASEYAIYVHQGYVTRNGNELPGRPWTKRALQKRNPSKVFSKLLETKL